MNIFKNRTVIGLLCIVLSLVICFAITPMFNRTISEKTETVSYTHLDVYKRQTIQSTVGRIGG